MKRLFIAINLPKEVKKEISDLVEEINRKFPRKSVLSLRKSAFRFLSPENWHITITFLSYQPTEAIPQIMASIKRTAERYSNILENIRISFDKIIFAPPHKTPRMIWLLGGDVASQKLGEMKLVLDDELRRSRVHFKAENRQFNIHITLARFDSSISPKFDFPKMAMSSFKPKSIDLMESHLSRSGAQYEILFEAPFIK